MSGWIPQSMTQLSQLFQQTLVRLEQAGIEDARQEALQLMEFCLGARMDQLLLHPDREVDGESGERLAAALARRLAREPLQYITGFREFWSLEFMVSPDVLIPRPETEFLLDHVLAVIRRQGYTGGPVLDMCTGSGVIATVLALELGARKVVAVDRSFPALQLAERNWQRHGLAKEILPLCADLFTAFLPTTRFEVIVANPPYVAESELAELQPEVRDWEPDLALRAGERGLDIIARIASLGHSFLSAGGWLFSEIGAGQEDEVYALFTRQAGDKYEKVEVLKDWSGRPRVVQARKRGGE